MTGPITVKVDWAKNGNYTNVGDDVTDRVRGSFSAGYGRDQTTSLSPIIAGQGSFTLDNRSRDYSPRNASSPLFGKVKPARPVIVQRLVGATTYSLFTGHTDDSPIDPDVENKTVTLNCVDSLADFRGLNITTQLYQSIRTGTAIGYVLDAAGWAGGRGIDTGATLIPWFWAEGSDAFDTLQQLVASEGSPALISIDPSGAFIFRDRHHRLRLSASTTSQATFRGTGNIEPIMGMGYSYSDNWSNIVNYVSLSMDERAPTGELIELWSTDETLSLGNNEARTIVVQASDPFYGAIAPVSGTDFTVDTGSIVSSVLSRTSGAATSITLTAGAAGAAITAGIALRGYSVPVIRTYQIQSTDSTSITDYGQRSLPSGQEPVWASRYDATAIANLLTLQRAQPLPLLTIRFSCHHTQTVRLNAVLARDISDRVTVVEPETAINGPFFIEAIKHSVSSIANHEVTFNCEAVPSAPTSSFILDSSTLNGAATLGY